MKMFPIGLCSALILVQCLFSQAQFSSRDTSGERPLSLQERLLLHQKGRSFSRVSSPLPAPSSTQTPFFAPTISTSTIATVSDRGRRLGLASLLNQRQSRLPPSRNLSPRLDIALQTTELPEKAGGSSPSPHPRPVTSSLPPPSTDNTPVNDQGRLPGLASLIQRLRARGNTNSQTDTSNREAKAIDVLTDLRKFQNRQRVIISNPDSIEEKEVAYEPLVTTESNDNQLTNERRTTLYSLASLQTDTDQFEIKTRQTVPPVDRFCDVSLTKVTNFADFTSLPESTTEKMKPKGVDEAEKIADTSSVKPIVRLEDRFKIEEVDISAFLPQGYENIIESTEAEESETSQLVEKQIENEPTEPITSVFFSNSDRDKNNAETDPSFVIEEVDISSFLPTNYKLKSDQQPNEVYKIKEADVSAFLPPDYKTKSSKKDSEKEEELQEIDAPPRPDESKSNNKKPFISKFTIEEVDISSFLPPGYEQKTKPTESVSPRTPSKNSERRNPSKFRENVTDKVSTEKAEIKTSTERNNNQLGLVFPGGASNTPRSFLDFLGLNKSKKKTTTPVPPTLYNSTESLFDRIKNRPKFTGWPTEPTKPTEQTTTTSTTPTPQTSTSTEATTTTTTMAVTRVPTTPGQCGARCKMAATVKIVEGLQWRPELAVRGTRDWLQTAGLVKLELMEAFQASPLGLWVDHIDIDAFSRGSVVVDYNVYFNDKLQNLNTKDVKILFEEGLLETKDDFAPFNDSAISSDALPSVERNSMLRMGAFVIDPVSNDFVVFRDPPPVITHTSSYPIPEWLIAVIVVGMTALLFMLVFGIVLMWKRRKRRKAPRAGMPLTADVLNELDRKQHGPGPGYKYPNYDVYDPDDAWDNDKVARNKRLRPPMKNHNVDIKNYNIYDSWKSDISAAHTSGGWSRKKVQNTFDSHCDDF